MRDGEDAAWERCPETVAAARRWFTEPALREVSGPHDERETAGSRVLALHVALSELADVPAVVLDLGCGGGEMLTLAATATGARLVGVDPAPQAIEAAEQALSGLRERVVLSTRSAEQLHSEPLLVGPGTVSLALAHLCLGLWEEPLEGLVQGALSLGPGGLLYAVDLLRPADATAAEPFLGVARDAGERTYLLAQLAASFDLSELEQLAARVSERTGLATSVHVGGLGGHPFGSEGASRLWSDRGVREALDALGELTPVEAVKAEQVFHLRVDGPIR